MLKILNTHKRSCENVALRYIYLINVTVALLHNVITSCTTLGNVQLYSHKMFTQVSVYLSSNDGKTYHQSRRACNNAVYSRHNVYFVSYNVYIGCITLQCERAIKDKGTQQNISFFCKIEYFIFIFFYSLDSIIINDH